MEIPGTWGLPASFCLDRLGTDFTNLGLSLLEGIGTVSLPSPEQCVLAFEVTWAMGVLVALIA